MTIPQTIRLKQTSETLEIRYRPNNDSWRYLILLFSVFCLSPIVFEAYTSDSIFLYSTVSVGVLCSLYIILSRENFIVSLRSDKQSKDPYRNIPREPLFFVGRQQITPSGATLHSIELETFQETGDDGAPIDRYKLVAVYNTARLLLLPRINQKAEADAILAAFAGRLHARGE